MFRESRLKKPHVSSSPPQVKAMIFQVPKRAWLRIYKKSTISEGTGLCENCHHLSQSEKRLETHLAKGK